MPVLLICLSSTATFPQACLERLNLKSCTTLPESAASFMLSACSFRSNHKFQVQLVVVFVIEEKEREGEEVRLCLCYGYTLKTSSKVM